MSVTAETLIATEAELRAFLSSIPPSYALYLDLEGNNLSRNRTISLIKIHLHPQGLTRIVDILALGKLAFTTISEAGRNLKSILEDQMIEDRANDLFEYDDDVGYYDEYSDDGPCNAANGALFPEHFDSCWDKN